MRVLQLIDSLRPGGAERVAVNYANALVGKIDASFLCSTRLEGNLKKEVRSEVGYLFLQKKNVLDLKAFFKLRTFILENRIDVIQAHSSSYFLASLVKLSLKDLKLIWHDHWGKRASKEMAPPILKQASRLFDGVISVNNSLAAWAREQLHARKVIFIKNFILNSGSNEIPLKLQMKKSFKIVCVANLRPEKDHLNLLKAFYLMLRQEGNVSLHLIGQDENDYYSQEIKNFIATHGLEKQIFIYGLQDNISGILEQADLGVLSSMSEGMPVALLEYGMKGLPVVATSVGEVPDILKGYGELVPTSDPSALAQAMLQYVGSEAKRRKDAANFQQKVIVEYSEDVVMPEIMKFYKLVAEIPSDNSAEK